MERAIRRHLALPSFPCFRVSHTLTPGPSPTCGRGEFSDGLSHSIAVGDAHPAVGRFWRGACSATKWRTPRRPLSRRSGSADDGKPRATLPRRSGRAERSDRLAVRRARAGIAFFLDKSPPGASNEGGWQRGFPKRMPPRGGRAAGGSRAPSAPCPGSTPGAEQIVDRLPRRRGERADGVRSSGAPGPLQPPTATMGQARWAREYERDKEFPR